MFRWCCGGKNIFLWGSTTGFECKKDREDSRTVYEIYSKCGGFEDAPPGGASAPKSEPDFASLPKVSSTWARVTVWLPSL